MQKAIIIISILLGYLFTLSAQGVKIGNNSNVADASAMLDVESTNKGVLHPRMTESERDNISNPATGLLIFQTDGTIGFYYHSGTAWTPVHTGTPAASPPTYAAGTVHCNGTPTAIVDVTTSTGKTWMDRNLGATQVASSSTDTASYGDLYQWGRGSDGHQCRTSGTTATLSIIDQPGHGNFILAPNIPYDWRSSENTNLWGVSGINNPCPSGYRLPTDTELVAERDSWTSIDAAGALASPLKLPMAGYRSDGSGSLGNVGARGYYWSSTVSSTFSRYLRFGSTSANMFTYYRASGFAVRCLKD